MTDEMLNAENRRLKFLLGQAVDTLDSLVLRIGTEEALPVKVLIRWQAGELGVAKALLARFRTEVPETAERQP